MYRRLIFKNIRRHPFINVLILLQLTAVFVLTVLLVSAIDLKTRDAEHFSQVLDSKGFVVNGYVSRYADKSKISSMDELASHLRGAKSIDTVSYAHFDIEFTDSYKGRHCLAVIYSDALAGVYPPVMDSGSWITDAPEDDLPTAVVTFNSCGYTTGDIVEIRTETEKKIRIVGVIGDNEYFFKCPTDPQLYREPSYKAMLSRQHDSRRDTLREMGKTDEEIDTVFEYERMEAYSPETVRRQLRAQGYSRDEVELIVSAMGSFEEKQTLEVEYNTPVFFFTETQWNRFGFEDYLITRGSPMLVRVDDGLSEEDMLYNRRFLTQELLNIDCVIPYSEIAENTRAEIAYELYILMPVIAAVFILVLIGAVSLNAIICKSSLRDYAVMYLCGSRRSTAVRVGLLYDLTLCVLSVILAAEVLAGLGISGITNSISFGLTSVLSLVGVILLFTAVCAAVPMLMIRRNDLCETLAKKDIL